MTIVRSLTILTLMVALPHAAADRLRAQINPTLSETGAFYGDASCACRPAPELCTSCIPHRGWGVVGGAESTFLVPTVNGTVLISALADLSPAGAGFELIDDFGLDMMTYAPRVWFGLSYDDWGLVSRFWYLSDTQQVDGPDGLGADFFLFDGSNFFKAYNVDLEAVRYFLAGDWSMNASLGVRHASFESTSVNSLVGAFDDAIARATAFSDRTFSGAGLTFALGGKRPLFGGPALHLIGNLRSSILWGDARFTAESDTTFVVDGLAAASTFDLETVNFADELFIGEVQLGIQWDHALRRVPANAFIRIVGEYQYWGGVNEFDLEAGAFDGFAGEVAAAAEARVGGMNAHLAGFSLGAGFDW